MNYPLIKKFLPELQVFDADKALSVNRSVVDAEYLEAELAKGIEYYGYFENTYELYNTQDNAKYKGLVIGYHLIESQEPVSKDELLKLLTDYKISDIPEFRKVVERIKKNGIR